MGIVTNSNLPNLVLQLNVPQRSIFYKGITKVVPDSYWNDEVVTVLYPLWDTDKDKLIMFTWYDNNTYHAQRRKYLKDFQKNEYFWKDYEMEQMDNDEAAKLYEFFKDTFYLNDSIENQEFQNELSRIYAETNSVNWLTVRLARNFLLTESDWIFNPDSGINEENKDLWIKYRKALRDLPTNLTITGRPEDINFPINPKMYVDMFLHENEGVEYLSTSEQFLPLGEHYLTTFREKMVRYLIVKETTETIYYNTLLHTLKTNEATRENFNDITLKDVSMDDYTKSFAKTYDINGEEKNALDLLLKYVEDKVVPELQLEQNKGG